MTKEQLYQKLVSACEELGTVPDYACECLQNAVDSIIEDDPAPETELDRKLAEVERLKEENLWSNHPKYPRSDWRCEVYDDDTILGYWDWVVCSIESDHHDDETTGPVS